MKSGRKTGPKFSKIELQPWGQGDFVIGDGGVRDAEEDGVRLSKPGNQMEALAVS